MAYGCHPVVEIFNTWSSLMATVNFSVPADVKDAFDKAFRRQNKSAVLTDLMRQAVEERRRRQRRAKVVEQLLALRKRTRRVTDKTVRAARRHGRP
jgi:metal-responsive CopG/Arc/MetJ family transcriptional regulator